VPAINTDEIKEYLTVFRAPYVLKPRSDVSAMGFEKMESREEVWSVIDELNQRESLRERLRIT